VKKDHSGLKTKVWLKIEGSRVNGTKHNPEGSGGASLRLSAVTTCHS
jgi:hypothetical protein